MHEALCRPSGASFDTSTPRDGPPITQRTSRLAVSAAPTMSEAATAGVSEACAMPVAAAEITGETAGHAMSEAVAEIAVRARIVRSVASVIG